METIQIIKEPIFTNDAIVFGLLMAALGIVFYTSNHPAKIFKRFYKFIPALLMCYMIPALMSTLGLINSQFSGLWDVAKSYLLPTALILMTLSIDLKGIIKLGPKALIMFFTATVGIMLGGPFAILLMSVIWPETLAGEGFQEVWRGLATLAGSWIGGGANQTAMLEVYQYNDSLYTGMVLVDIVVANIWMAFLLLGVGRTSKIDKWLKADSSAIEQLKENVKAYQEKISAIPTLNDSIKVLAVGFAGTALAHWASNMIVEFFIGIDPAMKDSTMGSSFFWLVVITTTIGLLISFTKMRKLEGVGASRMGSVMIYILVAVIGMKMDITKAADNPGLIVLGLIWMAFHVGLLVVVAKIIRAPYFFLAVGSKANIGGAASAPVVAGAFHPSLAPVGVLLAVLGYAVGTYGAILCAQMMQIVSP